MSEVRISDLWGTPPALYDEWNKEFSFTAFDPAPFPKPDDFDGSEVEWPEGPIFVNPPFSALDKFCRKAVFEQKRGRTIVLLIPARTHRNYFHDYVIPNAEIRFLRPITFVGLHESNKGNKDAAPFPCVLCIFRASETPTDNPEMLSLKRKRAPSKIVKESPETPPRKKKKIDKD